MKIYEWIKRMENYRIFYANAAVKFMSKWVVIAMP